jgi:hypothetical protein
MKNETLFTVENILRSKEYKEKSGNYNTSNRQTKAPKTGNVFASISDNIEEDQEVDMMTFVEDRGVAHDSDVDGNYNGYLSDSHYNS